MCPGYLVILSPPGETKRALPAADGRGLAGRPAVAVEGCPDVLLAGEWFGCRGKLAGAAASAEESADRAIIVLARSRNGPERRPVRVGR